MADRRGALPQNAYPNSGGTGLETGAILPGFGVVETIDPYDGDPKILIDEDGADFNYLEGQPEMVKGFNNDAIIALMTTKGWVGNNFLRTEQQIGSDFEATAGKGPITLSKIANVENVATLALACEQYKVENVTVEFPTSKQCKVDILLNNLQKISLTKSGLNWKAQAQEGN